jgi:hypothetical protein
VLDDSHELGEGRGDPTGASSRVTGCPAEGEGTDEMEAEVILMLLILK